jgi:branched-chain amino acid transport system permease protein
MTEGRFRHIPVVDNGVLVGIVESLGAGFISGTYKDVYAFVLLIVVLMVRPSGLLGVTIKLKA